MRDYNGREDQASEERSSIRRLFKKAALFARRLYLVVRPFGESDLKRDTKYASRFTGVESARQISPDVHDGRRGRRATSRRKDCRDLNFYRRGDRLQYVNNHACPEPAPNPPTGDVWPHFS